MGVQPGSRAAGLQPEHMRGMDSELLQQPEAKQLQHRAAAARGALPCSGLACAHPRLLWACRGHCCASGGGCQGPPQGSHRLLSSVSQLPVALLSSHRPAHQASPASKFSCSAVRLPDCSKPIHPTCSHHPTHPHPAACPRPITTTHTCAHTSPACALLHPAGTCL